MRGSTGARRRTEPQHVANAWYDDDDDTVGSRGSAGDHRDARARRSRPDPLTVAGAILGRRLGHAVAARRCRQMEEHTSELQSPCNLVCRLLLEKKKQNRMRGASNIRV